MEMSLEELKAWKIKNCPKQLNEILSDFANGTVSHHHMKRIPRYDPAHAARLDNAESQWAGMFRMLTNDLYIYDQAIAVDFALRGAGLKKNDPKDFDLEDHDVRHLEVSRQKRLPAIGHLKLTSMDLLENFYEQGYEFTEPEALRWLAVRDAVKPDEPPSLQ